MTRERLAWLVGLLALAALGWWFTTNTEWVEEDRYRPAQGEARDNPVYAFEQLLRRLDMKVEHHDALDRLPPEQARLVLLSSDWDLMPERAERLHEWVLRGGHLVLVHGSNGDLTAIEPWVPIDVVRVKGPKVPEDVPVGAAPAFPFKPKVVTRTVLTSSPPLWNDTEAFAPCAFFPTNRSLFARTGQRPLWALKQDTLTQVVRVPMGQGTLTAINTGGSLFHNASALECDTPLLLAAAVQAEAGATAWIYLNEKREALLPWLWHEAWVVIVFAALALAAALWRGSVRFGPLVPTPPRLRRSITEQVRGVGAYLQREGRGALLAAQQRALGDVASRTLPGYGRLPPAQRAQAVAQATQLNAADLSTAMSASECKRSELPQLLQWLELARRRLQKTHEERHSP